MSTFRENHFADSELAAEFGCHVRTLKRWRDSRGLPFIRLCGRVYYNKASVATWLAAQEQQVAA